MGFRPTFDVQHKKQLDPLVDKKIGNAYATVEYVAQNMAKLLDLTPKGYEERYVKGSLTLIGQTVLIPLPADIDVTKIRSSVIQIRSTLYQIYTEQSGVFSAFVNSSGLSIKLLDNAPITAQNATVMWTITYGVGDEA